MDSSHTDKTNIISVANNDEEWSALARKSVKVLMARRDVSSYKELSVKLKEINVHEDPHNLSTKINRGTFSAKLFLQIIKALDLKNINIDYE